MSYRNFGYLLLLAVLQLSSCSADEESAEVSDQTDPSTTAEGLFDPVAPDHSGIDFVNTVRSDFSFNHVNYGYLFNGAGVGVLDYDGDGLQDLYFVSNQDPNKLYRNLGDFRFEDVTETAGVSGVEGFDVGVSIADVDGNGYPDIYVTRTGIDNSPGGRAARANLLYLNNGDGTFRENAAAMGLASDRPGTQATFFDYDLDGDLDMYQMNTPLDFDNVNTVRAKNTARGVERITGPSEDWESDQLFRNDGGTFTDVTKSADLVNRGYGLSTIIYDFNRDGLPDIYVANDYIDDDAVYINSPGGKFTDQSRVYLRHTALNAMGSDLGDLNNDGLEDIVSLDMLAEPQDRKKQLESNMRPDRYNLLVRLGYTHQLMRNQLQLNNGQNFSEVGEVADIDATDWSWAPLIVDFDNDGRQDIFISNGYRYDLTDVDFISYTVDSIMAMGGLRKEMFEDFSAFLDLIPTVPQANYLYRNRADLDFENVAAQWNVGQPSYSSSAVYADLDNDGDVDLVVGNHEQPPFVYRNRATDLRSDANWLQLEAEGYAGNTAGLGVSVLAVVGDERVRQTLQPSRGFLGSNAALLHFGLGDRSTVERLEVTWPDGKTQVITDVKANQRLQLRHADAGNAQLAGAGAGARFGYPQGQRGLAHTHRENAFSDFDRQFLQPRMLSREGPALAVADVDGDGLEDIFFGGAAGAPAKLFRQGGNGTFAPETIFPATENRHEDVKALFLDYDGDGDADLYVTSGGNHAPADDPVYQDRMYRNDDGTFTLTAALPAMPTSTGAVAALDFDEDGDLDLVVGGRSLPGSYPLAPRSYLLRNNGGSFEDVTELLFPELANLGMITALATGDLTGNGKPELVVAGEWLPVTTYEFSGQGFRVVPDGPSVGRGFWQSLLVADLDGDGRNELVAGNDGLNTRFQPGSGSRVVLYASDFDGNGAIDPVVTFEDERGRMVPIATKAMMLKQMPGLKKKYVRAADYSSASITDLFSREAVAAANQYELETVSSVVVRRSGDGWTTVKLPRMAQTAPMRDLAAVDVNDDGLLDLLTVGNDYGLQVETGRIDAGNGVLLLNRGEDGFTFEPNHRHGFWASLDARALRNIRLADGSRGWVIANNNGPAALYEQR